MTQKSPYTELTFQLIVESAPNAIVLVNKEGKIAYVNDRTEKLFGYSRTELIGQNVEILIPARFQDKHPQYRDHFFQSPSVKAMGGDRELFAMRKDGLEIPIEIGLNPLVTVEGTLTLASIIDITERKKAEKSFKLVVEASPNAMILVNKTGVITLANKAATELFGYSYAEIIGLTIENLIPARFHSSHITYRTQYLKSPTTRRMGPGRSLFALKKDGTEIPVEIGLNSIESEEGTVTLASIIDISEHLKQEKIYKEQMQLKLKNKQLEQFAYIASHDLQEPLRTVSNYLQVIKEDFSSIYDTDHGKKYIDAMHKATNRMSVLIQSLLEYSRLGRNKELKLVNLNAVISEIINDLQHQIQKTNAEILIINNLPSLMLYETEARQLFQNLINNAIKFRKKDIAPIITIDVKEENDTFLFSIKDNGIGISEKHFDRIFEMFQKLHNHNTYEGFGIGLPNCKKIVELHNGEMWVESVPEHYSKFYFTLYKNLYEANH